MEDVYKHQINIIRQLDYIQGMSPWILKDFRSALRSLNGIQDVYNRKGLVSETGQRKQAFAVLADYYAARDAAFCTGRVGAEHAPC